MSRTQFLMFPEFTVLFVCENNSQSEQTENRGWLHSHFRTEFSTGQETNRKVISVRFSLKVIRESTLAEEGTCPTDLTHRIEPLGVADGVKTTYRFSGLIRTLSSPSSSFHHCFLSALELSHQTGLLLKRTSSLEGSLTLEQKYSFINAVTSSPTT